MRYAVYLRIAGRLANFTLAKEMDPMTLVELVYRCIEGGLENAFPAEGLYDLTVTKESREDTSDS